MTLSLVMAVAFAPASASAAAGPSSAGVLSPRLAALAKPTVRSLSPTKQARMLSLAHQGPGSLLREGNRVLVEVRFAQGAAAGLDALRAAGARIVDLSRRYQTVTVAARPSDLGKIAATANVAGVTEVLAPIVSAAGCAGLVTSEGDSQLRAAEARSAFNLDGSGVTVGILSDSFNAATLAADGNGPVATHAAEDIASGDLPGPGNPCGHTTPVDVVEDLEDPEAADEGRAMAQIVHDLAPGAGLAFATAYEGELSFAENIERLASPAAAGGAGAQVIADDVAYLDEPFFQDGPIAAAVDAVAAKGVAYFSAVGNNNLVEAETGNEIGSWEAPEFRDSGGCPASLVTLSEEVEAEEVKLEEELEIEFPGLGLNAQHCMDFNPSETETDDTFGISVAKGATLIADLQWAEPWEGVNSDIDAFLLNSAGEVVAGSAEDNVFGSQRPFELVAWENETGAPQEVRLVINRYGGGDPRLKFALLQNGRGVTATEYPESLGGDTVGPTVFGHSGAAGAVGMGAVRFNTTAEPEEYSSRGPVTHYFGPVAPTSPAAELESPQTIPKPDLVATDCGLTTFFLPTETAGIYRLCGTSAAAPHAAAVAALMRQANPSLLYGQLRTALAVTAKPVGAFGADAVGAGLIDAYGAVSRVALPPAVTITEPPPQLGRSRTPSVGFTANRPVAFACSIDGGASQSCSSPFTPSRPLADGKHGFAVSGTDAANRTGTSGTVFFTIDTKSPRTFFRRHPGRVVGTRHRRARVVFRFGSNERGVTFVCRVDGGLLRVCRERFVRRFRVGPHVVRAMARDAAGNVDPTPAVFRFRVKHRGS